ncbi:sensor histidine kinase [Spirosoma pollinicola]|uniref:histidine kinase n=1 Tax=Spirosoma pollinicola TaxID=2057025 RepID=A0A2K8Z198_9BACT|nr:7TM diverse intracellular signaling domain-containing protein [Spirosoma pollinicola]AUD03663.1 hypothetical protein CWM47_18625 [Spirosoma pollinicola]
MLTTIRLLGFIISYLLCLQGQGQTVFLRDPAHAYDLFKNSSMLEVQPGRVSIDSLLQNRSHYLFTPTQNQKIHPDDYQRAYWFRVDLTNQVSDAFFLHFVYSGTERIDVFEVANNQIVNRQQFGRLVTESRELFRFSKLIYPLHVPKGQTHTLYIYMQGIYTTALYVNARSAINLLGAVHTDDLFYGLYYGLILIIVVYSLLLFVRLGDRDTLLYAIWVLSVGAQLALYRGFTAEFLWANNPIFERYGNLLEGLTGFMHVLFTIYFLRLRQQASYFYRVGLVAIAAYVLGTILFVITAYWGNGTGRTIDVIPLIALAEGVYSIVTAFVIYRQGFKPALFYFVGNLVFFASIFIFLLYAYGKLPYLFWTYNSIHIGSGFEIILFTLALSYKVNLLKEKQDEAIKEQLRLSEDNRQLVETQNQVLEQQVEIRTRELHSQKETLKATLTTLQTTQDQLIQKEKMASLGELTAGIAHEIRNPLNFVNNFSEVSTELVDELKENVLAGHTDELVGIADELSQNLQKITQHGKRAEAILKAMLEHARTTSGERQLTDLNALAKEYLQLAYQNLHTKDSTFQATLQTDLDPKLPPQWVVPQELSRVLINLYNNAFYAVRERQRKAEEGYEPVILLRTSFSNGQAELRICDNGTGIPESIRKKVFQPFFTTKPTGQGTGLGLSLSYDVITKGHGGVMSVESQFGEGSEFLIQLPPFAG